ncbi:hypothetical protein IW261DRAFT_1428532 [Armillaria novae-zelandiae]|uniref:Uncharacterized protein n=1 Tax=Armillaria novae-zelandiae TaxID=153914 RepID=A0AA39N9H3_9AGAR|nr:hypothetical protein IW261DRAFT_1428532 [Armillaria novae-zelandiae]
MYRYPTFGMKPTNSAKALETPLDHRRAMLLVYQGEVLNWRAHWEQRYHVAVTRRVTAWRSSVPVVQSHLPPVHPFDWEQRLLAILDNRQYSPADVPDDAPTLDAGEYEQWLKMTLIKRQRHHDKEASSKERNIHWHQMWQDLHHEPEDWADFQRRKREVEAQHYRARRDAPTNTISGDMPSVGPSGSTTIMPSQANPPTDFHHRHQVWGPRFKSSLVHLWQQQESSVRFVEVDIDIVRITGREEHRRRRGKKERSETTIFVTVTVFFVPDCHE